MAKKSTSDINREAKAWVRNHTG